MNRAGRGQDLFSDKADRVTIRDLLKKTTPRFNLEAVTPNFISDERRPYVKNSSFRQ
jgi:hypothetical protein